MTPAKITHILNAGRGVPASFVAKAKDAAGAMKDGDEKSALVKAIAAAKEAPEPETVDTTAKAKQKPATGIKPAKGSDAQG